ncbi:MAG: TonB-dependent receptor [Bacteroidota bacterium]
MKKLILNLALIMITIATVAQEVSVFSHSDIQPVSKCLIYNLTKTISTTTNNKGVADITSFKSSDTLVFNHLSFRQVKITKQDLLTSGNKIYLSGSVFNLDEIVLSANKVEEKYRDIAAKIDIIPARQIKFDNPQTSADLLQQSGNVFVQMSQLGAGSPVIRGMETSRVLIVVDGVRMNNAIYRAGHLQSVITIDPNALQRVEILHGPGSVIYGSDAMGGVMHFYTKNPVLSNNGKVFTSGDAFVRYSTAAGEKAGNLSLNAGWKKFGVYLSGTFKDIGDLHEGSNRDSKYGDWGKSLYYAERINGQDSMVVNSDPLIQKNSGYSQYDILAKAMWKPNQNHVVTMNVQYSNSSDIPRYDRLTEMSKGKLKYAEWYYGPQTRSLVSLKSEWFNKNTFYDYANITAAWQNISEDRISRSFGKSKKKHQEETVDVLSLNVDLMKKIFPKSELRYGIESTVNYVDSKTYNQNITSGEITFDAATRYPDGGDQMASRAFYISNNWEISKKLIFSQGLRASHVSLLAKYTPEMLAITKFPYAEDITQENSAINGSLGLVIMPDGGWRIATNLSTGFRAPNIDDMSKLNDSNSADQLLMVPNPALKPEYAYNAELTIGKTFGDRMQVEATGFYTLLKDAFVARPFLYNGQDSVVFDGTLCGVQALQNAEKAEIYGFEGNLTIKLTKVLSLKSSLTYTNGQIKDDTIALDHIPPMFGMTSLKLELKQFTGEIYARYNGWKHIKDYSPSGEDNETYAAVENGKVVGMPSWYTLNLRAGYHFNRFLNLQVGVENIMDQHYRLFASGISAPGRNIIATLRASF